MFLTFTLCEFCIPIKHGFVNTFSLLSRYELLLLEHYFNVFKFLYDFQFWFSLSSLLLLLFFHYTVIIIFVIAIFNFVIFNELCVFSPYVFNNISYTCRNFWRKYGNKQQIYKYISTEVFENFFISVPTIIYIHIYIHIYIYIYIYISRLYQFIVFTLFLLKRLHKIFLQFLQLISNKRLKSCPQQNTNIEVLPRYSWKHGGLQLYNTSPPLPQHTHTHAPMSPKKHPKIKQQTP